MTCPLHRMQLGELILSAKIDDSQPWRAKFIKILRANYSKTARFEETMALLEPLITMHQTNLAAFNIAGIEAIAAHLGLRTRFVRQSDLAHEGKASELLISLIHAVGGTAYLAGGGADGYQEDELFVACGIELIYQHFTPRPYGPPEKFHPGLSVIDYLMRDGQLLDNVFCG